MKTCPDCGKTYFKKTCMTCTYRSSIVPSNTPHALQTRWAAFARVLRKHGVKWEGA